MDEYKMNVRDETVTPNRYGVDGPSSTSICEYAEEMLHVELYDLNLWSVMLENVI